MSIGTAQLAVTTQNALRGYGLETTSDVNKDLICSLCLHPAFQGVVTACEHAFHEDCLEHEGDTLNTCPICRSRIDGKRSLKSPGRLLSNILGQYVVHCPQSCGGNVPFEEIENHVMENCSNTPFACPHEGCDHGALLRAECVQHAEICDHRRVVCRCTESIKKKHLKAHKATICPQEPITCGYCKQGEIERGNMKIHLREGCKASATISLVKPLQDKIQELTEQIQELKEQLLMKMPPGRFKVRLPECIRDLPFDSQGWYKQVLTDGWSIEISSEDDIVAVWLISRANVEASFTIKIGECQIYCESVVFTGESGVAGYKWGYHNFANIGEVCDKQMLEVTISVHAFIVKPALAQQRPTAR